MLRLSILQELFESKDIFLFMLGIIISILFACFQKEGKVPFVGMVISFGVYVFCEIIAPKSISYTMAFGILFLGWFCLGSTIGFLLCIGIKCCQK